MRVGVIGAGAMGQNHIRTYSQMPGVELVGIADLDKKRIDSLSKLYGTQGFLDYKQLLDCDLDAVSIVVPTTLHRQVAMETIDRGINLLVEKPFADTVNNAMDILQAARNKDVKLMVGHIERFNPAVIKMKELIQTGVLGKIVSINTRRVGPYNPRIRDVGVILDIGVHDIDVISYLYHSQPREVYAVAGNGVHKQEDHASIILRFDNNRSGVVETNWLTPHKIRTFTVIGTEAVGYGDYIDQKIFVHDEDWVKEAKVERSEPLRKELEYFVDCCASDIPPMASGEDGISALQAALASIESYKLSTAVKIPPLDRIFTNAPLAERAMTTQ